MSNNDIRKQINQSVAAMFNLGDISGGTPEDLTDAVMVFNKKSGCYSTNDRITHLEACNCSDDYDQFAQDKENWL